MTAVVSRISPARQVRWILGGAAILGVVIFVVWAKHRIGGLSAETSATNPIIRWEWLFKRSSTPSELRELSIEHLKLTALPVAAGLVLSSILAATALRFRWTFAPITAIAGFLYTVPSLALFAVLTVYLSTFQAAVVALTTYTLLILVRNIVAGIDGVPEAVLSAADGMGMSRRRRLFTVELPLALPVIMAGVRVATVTTIGLVAITGAIQLGGFGFLIFDGYNTQFFTKITVGAVLSVLLAVVLDLLIRRIERILTPWTRRRIAR
ncbi:MAG: ABC transporter permease [Actinomycetota bacterium]|nr:ABC transporter permease [Actinomycetota bacterium]